MRRERSLYRESNRGILVTVLVTSDRSSFTGASKTADASAVACIGRHGRYESRGDHAQ